MRSSTGQKKPHLHLAAQHGKALPTAADCALNHARTNSATDSETRTTVCGTSCEETDLATERRRWRKPPTRSVRFVSHYWPELQSRHVIVLYTAREPRSYVSLQS